MTWRVDYTTPGWVPPEKSPGPLLEPRNDPADATRTDAIALANEEHR